MKLQPLSDDISSELLKDVRLLIESARNRTAQAFITELTMLYWRIGKRIRNEILKDERAEYGRGSWSP